MLALGTRLGTALGTVINGPPAPFDPLSTSPFAAWRADVVDTATNFDWTDRTGNGHVLRQATGANKPTVVDPSEIASASALRFDGTDDYLASTEAAATWTFAHTGAGSALWIVAIPRNTTASTHFLGTYNGGATPGFWLLKAATATTLRMVGFTDAGGFSCDLNAASALALDTPFAALVSLETGASPEAAIEPTAGAGASSALTTPGAAAPSATLNIGRRSNGTAYSQIDIAEIIVWDRRLTSDEKTSLAAYRLERYGF